MYSETKEPTSPVGSMYVGANPAPTRAIIWSLISVIGRLLGRVEPGLVTRSYAGSVGSGGLPAMAPVPLYGEKSSALPPGNGGSSGGLNASRIQSAWGRLRAFASISQLVLFLPLLKLRIAIGLYCATMFQKSSEVFR